MKKVLGIVFALALLAGVAVGDSYTYTYDATCGAVAVVSDQIPVSGWLDRIEIGHKKATTETSTVIVATYDASTNAVTTFASATTRRLSVIPRFVATSSAGTAFVSTFENVTQSNTLIQVVAPYERPMVDGRIRISVAGNGVAGATNTCSVTIIYEPTKR